MPEFAVVAPPQVLLEWPYEHLPKWHLMLAHDIVKQRDKYIEIAAKLWRRFGTNGGPFIYMDNSVVETGGAVDVDMVLEAVQIVQAQIACMPDVIGSGPATTHAIWDAWQLWQDKFNAAKLGFRHGGNFKGFMMIPQGSTKSEFYHCVSTLPTDGSIAPFIGIPRHIADKGVTRRDCYYLINALHPHKKVHLLGFAEDMSDDILTCQLSAVTSIDSAVPMRAASYRQKMSPSMTLPPRGNWWEVASYNEEMYYNYRTYQNWIRV